jgi:hypothetical protein
MDRVRIVSTCKRVPQMDIVVYGEVHSFYSTSEEMLAVRQAVKPGAKDVATSTVSADEPFEISGIALDTDELSVEARPGDGPNTILLALSVPNTATAGFKKGVLSFDVVSGEKRARHTMRVFASVKK